nr:phosphoenolpyruvate carboxylase [Tanacetum cinerariifolium]
NSRDQTLDDDAIIMKPARCYDSKKPTTSSKDLEVVDASDSEVQECYELSAEYDGKRDPKKLEKVQVAYRRRIKLKNGYFADEDNATTECDIKETLDKLVH